MTRREPRKRLRGRPPPPTRGTMNHGQDPRLDAELGALQAAHPWSRTLAGPGRGRGAVPGRVRLHRRRPARRRGHQAVPPALRRLRITVGFRHLPRQPRRLRRLHPAHRAQHRQPRRRPRHRLRPPPRRPHRLDLTHHPRRTNRNAH